MKVDFKNVELPQVDGSVITANFQQQLGNHLYMTGNDIETCELGKRIYFAEGEIEVSDKEAAIIKGMIAPWSYVARTAIAKLFDK